MLSYITFKNVKLYNFQELKIPQGKYISASQLHSESCVVRESGILQPVRLLVCLGISKRVRRDFQNHKQQQWGHLPWVLQLVLTEFLKPGCFFCFCPGCCLGWCDGPGGRALVSLGHSAWCNLINLTDEEMRDLPKSMGDLPSGGD